MPPDALAPWPRVLTRWPLFWLVLMLGLLAWGSLDARALLFSDEVRYAAVLSEVFQGHWWVLHLNGEMYPDKPPIYFWLLALMAWLRGGISTMGLFWGSLLSAMAFLAALVRLARRVWRATPEVTLTAGLLFLTCLYCVGLTQYVRMDLLFAALMVWSQGLLYEGTVDEEPSPSARRSLLGGFALAGLAVLVKGPLGLVLPVVSLVAYLAWSGRLRRLWRRDMALGLGLALTIIALWLAGALLVEGKAFVHTVLYQQVYRRAVDTWHHNQPWWHYLVVLPLILLPWSLLLSCVPLGQLFTRDFWRQLAGRRRQAQGRTFVWIMAVSGLLFLSAISTKIVVYALPLFGPLAIIAAQTLLELSPPQGRRFWGVVAGLFLLAALAVPWGEILNPWGLRIAGLGLCATVLAVGGILLWRLRGNTGAALAILCVATVILLQPLGRLTLPSLDAAVSPKDIALLMRQQRAQGAYAVAYNSYSGIYTYYAGGTIMETADETELRQMLAQHPKVVVAFKEKDWLLWREKLSGAQVLHRQWIIDRPYVLVLVQGGPP